MHRIFSVGSVLAAMILAFSSLRRAEGQLENIRTQRTAREPAQLAGEPGATGELFQVRMPARARSSGPARPERRDEAAAHARFAEARPGRKACRTP